MPSISGALWDQCARWRFYGSKDAGRIGDHCEIAQAKLRLSISSVFRDFSTSIADCRARLESPSDTSGEVHWCQSLRPISQDDVALRTCIVIVSNGSGVSPGSLRLTASVLC